MGCRVREQVDYAHARDDKGEADIAAVSSVWPDHSQPDRRDEDDTDTGPQRIRDADGNGVQRQRQEIERYR